jgi:glycosyltransferase involved in cell wall biosynthesis
MLKRLRIAFAMINCNRRDGGARAVNEVAERLAQNHEVHLFARKAENLDLSRIRWRKMPGIPWPEVADFVTYHLLANFRIRRRSFDIVHSIGVNASAANVITIQNIQPAKRIFLDEQAASEKVSFARRMTRQLYLRVTTRAEANMYRRHTSERGPLFLPVSRGVERDLIAHYDIGNAPVRIIPNAADTHRFKPCTAAERQQWRQVNGIRERDTVAVFVGGEWRRKGLDLAIRALGRLPQKNVKLLVLGKDTELPRFQEIAVEAGVGSRVLFLGFRSDVAEAMAASDVFLFPSWYEAFSLATIEAAACGLPILATKINGAEEFVVPAETGFFIEHDPEQIAGVLGELVENAADRARMGANARRAVEQRYTWDRVAKLTEEAYLEYLDGGNSGIAGVQGGMMFAR